MNDATDSTLDVSTDPATEQTHFPARRFSVDGQLREINTVVTPARGVLAEFIVMGDQSFGYVDTAGGARIVGALSDGPHEIGADYVAAPHGDSRRWERA